jgi:hypothetical protein
MDNGNILLVWIEPSSYRTAKRGNCLEKNL